MCLPSLTPACGLETTNASSIPKYYAVITTQKGTHSFSRENVVSSKIRVVAMPAAFTVPGFEKLPLKTRGQPLFVLLHLSPPYTAKS